MRRPPGPRHDAGMQSSLLADDDLPDAAALAAAAARPPVSGHYDELRAAGGGALTARWQAFFQRLGADGWADLAARLKRVQQRVREDGITYNVHAEQGETIRHWPLELLPVIVEPDEWAVIEQGVQQRARLLEATLADLYGAQTLLRDALLPASLVYAHPQYLRAMHGLEPTGGTHLHIQAFDLARNPQGAWTLLAQRTQAPSGLGYLLENRLIVGPEFSDIFGAMRVQRLAASFRGLLDGLMRASPAGERSRIVLLTPGPHHETYFEQVFLARYLGLTLVEGSDLMVRGQRLYLKTLHGLERVHVVLRRVDDEWLDPLELRPDSQLGVPGLLQALRAGQVVMANAPGAGVLESPGLAAFWPKVARRLLGEELLLPAGTSWWCGEAVVWAQQRAKLADFVVLSTFPNGDLRPVVASQLSAAERDALAARIDADPAAYTLQSPSRPSETPVWADGQLQPRAAVLRVYVLADGAGGWRVLPGAMTRVAGPGDMGRDPWLSMQHGSASVDTWVVTRGAIDATTLLPKPLSAAELQGWHRTVSSRAAENLFWLGRYSERAENTARIARLVLETLPAASEPALRLMDDLVRYHGLVDAGVPAPWQSARLFERALVHGLGDPAGHTSVAFNLRELSRCAQALRERLSPEHWRLIHEVGDHFEQHLADVLAAGEGHAAAPDVLGVLARAATHLSAITGAQTDRMTRDDGWRLLSVGRQIERLDMLTHALAQGFERRVHEADDGFALLLGLFDSVITYRAQFQARREVLPLLNLLVRDTDNPRSLAWVARTMRDRLRKLARLDAVWAAEATAGLPEPEAWSLDALSPVDADGRHTALIDTLEDAGRAARALSDEITRHLFAHAATADRTVWQ
ncbi:MAG: circularly permuted type 2 ATP-grasp protein [Burkholderiales bacterium]|nr:circularly permuted type 2 ATP-grasp protein [Burkholderiales bacterium]